MESLRSVFWINQNR